MGASAVFDRKEGRILRQRAGIMGEAEIRVTVAGIAFFRRTHSLECSRTGAPPAGQKN
ncbi:MAG TPA: hypothetical protein VN667_17230 [Burkholderiales bacterium]|nr:hypothetical protein [Burkholderiales bacterium]